MKIILIQDVKDLGGAGEIVNVTNGYARNYLIPNDLALPATPKNMKLYEERKRRMVTTMARDKGEAEVLAERITEASCKVAKKVGENDVLYGSVTAADIAEALESEGIAVDKRKIHMEEPIKSLGVFEVPVRLHPEVTVTAKVWVVKE
jgi:large subunit ribosomal protein L9